MEGKIKTHTLSIQKAVDHHNTLPKKNCLLAISNEEKKCFLRSPVLEELKSLVTLIEITHPITDWFETLRETNAEIIVTGWTTPALPPDLPLEKLSLKYVAHVTGSIRTHIPRPLIEKGLFVTNWGTSVSKTIAESTVFMIMAALRKVGYWQNVIHNQSSWNQDIFNHGTLSIINRNIGIHGFGNIAKQLIPMLIPFSVKISAYCPYTPDEVFDAYQVHRAPTLNNLFSDNDVIVILSALTDETKDSITKTQLDLIPDDGVFVNSARAAIVNEADLIEVAHSNRIRIALDVFHQEPLPEDSPLRGNHNIILTPHTAGPTPDRMIDAGQHMLHNIRQFSSGKKIDGVIDIETYDLMT